MIEIVCKEELQEEKKDGKICLPKNIRQVGSPGGRHKIYIEDYVYTYLRTLSQRKEACAVIFLGKSQVMKDIRYTFVSGALECKASAFQWDNICLDDNCWEYIEQERKKYFPEKKIAGWFLGRAGQEMSLSPAVEAAHRKYFAGRDKILMLLDMLENEEVFFIYDQGYLQKREGFYIYYEKNLPMQEYMISRREEEQRAERAILLGETETKEQKKEKKKEEFAELRQELAEESSDTQEEIFVKSNLEEPKTQAEEALESYRYMMLERQGRQVERQNRNFLYTAASFFLVVICVIGITTINNYRKMQEVEDVLHVMKNDDSKDKKTEREDELVVESVSSQVTPLEEENRAEQNKQAAENAASAQDSQKGEEDAKDGQEGETDSQNSQEGSNSQNSQEGTDSQNSQEGTDSQNGQEGNNAQNSQEGTKPEEPSTGNESGNSGSTQETAGGQKEARYYTVQSGDTLASICLNVYKSKDMMKKVCEVNGIKDGDKIYVGQKLLLP